MGFQSFLEKLTNTRLLDDILSATWKRGNPCRLYVPFPTSETGQTRYRSFATMGDQPVFITKRGKRDLVVMSQAHYERLQSMLELYRKLAEAESLEAAGGDGISHEEMMQRIKERIR